MGEGLGEKIFYLTAKTITRTVAEETFGLLKQQGAFLQSRDTDGQGEDLSAGRGSV